MTKSGKTKTHPAGSNFTEDLNDWQCIAIIVILVAIFFYKLLTGSAYLWEDFLYEFYPCRNFAATTMADGRMPLWNPYTFSGMPFLADMQTAVFYLPCLLLTFFVKNGHLDFYWLEVMIILHYAIAGITMFYLARSFNLQRIPALFAGTSYMFSSYMILHGIHQPIVTMVAWFPLILLLFRKALHGGGLVWVGVTALVLGHTTFAGFPQLFLFIYYFLGGYLLFELFTTFRGRALISRPAVVMTTNAALVIALSLGLAMVQLLPTLELSQLAQRAEITYEFSTVGAMSWANLLSLIIPKFFGVAESGNYNYWGPGNAYYYYWETCLYQGALPLILSSLAVVYWRKEKHVPFWFATSLLTILYSLGGEFFLHKLFFDYVPGFSKFRNPTRTSVFMSFGISFLSAFSLQQFLGTADERQRVLLKQCRRILFGLIGAAVILWLLIVSSSLTGIFPFLKNPQIFSLVSSEANVSIFLFIISGLLVAAMLAKKLPRRVSGYVLLAILFVDLFVFGGKQNNSTMNPEEYFRRPAQLVQFLKQQSSQEVFRVSTRTSQGMIMDRNQGMIDRIPMIEGYTPLVLEHASIPVPSRDQMLDLLNVKYKTVADEQQRTLSLAENTTYLPRAFFRYAVRVFEQKDSLLTLLKSGEFDHRTMAVLEKDPGKTLPASPQDPAWKAMITSYADDALSVDVETAGDGLLVVSEIFYPGWKAYVDGKETEIFKTNYSLRGVFVDKGKHTVEMRFESASFSMGWKLTAASLFISVVFIGLPSIRNKRHTETLS